MTALARIPGPHRFTYDEVRRMVTTGAIDAKAPLELLDGELIDMPSEGFPHVSLKARLTQFLNLELKAPWLVVPDSTLYLSPQDAPEPDIYVVDETRFSFPVVPDSIALIVEVADTSLAYDLERKAPKYAQYALAEYWVVDVQSRETTVFTQPRPGGYASRVPAPFEQALTPLRLPEAALRIGDLRGWDGAREVGAP